jgi:hypothetical protein
MLYEAVYGVRASDADRVAEQLGATRALPFEKQAMSCSAAVPIHGLPAQFEA